MAARTAVVAGTATAVSGRVARRQANKYAGQEAATPQQAPMDQAPTAAGGDDTAAQLAFLHSPAGGVERFKRLTVKRRDKCD
jgi:hypothetical protein